MTNQSTARDVFIYLLVLVVLMMSTISLGALLFDFVNIYLPDPALYSMCSYDNCTGLINTEIAVLMVSFPVLVWAWRFLQRDLKTHPGKADLRIRKFLLYLTLFVSGIAAIIDLIQLINSWLNGELTLQFSLKLLAVLLIAGTTFYYFLRELHNEKGGRQGYAAWGAIAVVLASLALGIYTSAPWEAHDRAIDQERVSALQNIHGGLINFWQAKGRLPAKLDELEDSVSGFQVPVDPVTRQPYEYTKKAGPAFELCATFSTATRGGATDTRPAVDSYSGDPYGSNWSHGVGRTCFDRLIDPQLYPPAPKRL